MSNLQSEWVIRNLELEVSLLRIALSQCEKERNTRLDTDTSKKLQDIAARHMACQQRLEAMTADRNAWKSAALRIGEELKSCGPDGYYSYTPQEWREWTLGVIRECHEFLAVIRKKLDRLY